MGSYGLAKPSACTNTENEKYCFNKGCVYIYIYIRHRALCRVRGNEASELGTHSILLFDGLPNFTNLIQVSTYLEDCFVSINTYLGAPTPSARSNLTTPAEHLQNTCMNREPYSRSCWLILALLVAMLALLVAIWPLLLAIFSPTCPEMFRNRPRQPPECLRHRQGSPQDAQTPLPSLPKVQKNL